MNLSAVVVEQAERDRRAAERARRFHERDLGDLLRRDGARQRGGEILQALGSLARRALRLEQSRVLERRGGATADLQRDGEVAVGVGARDRARAAEQERAERRAVGDERHDDAAPRRERVHDVAHLGVVRQRVDRRLVQRLREHGATGAQHLAEEVLPVERRRRGEQAHQRLHLRRVGVRAGDATDRAVAVEQVDDRVVGELRQRGARDRVERARRIERLADQLSDAQQQVALLVGDDARR